MEFILFILAVGGVIYFAFSLLKQESDHTPPSRTAAPTLHLAELHPFDAQTAKKLPTTSILYGPAFVVDGDTLVIQKTQIRLFGVDAPELDHPYGQHAKAALINLCKGKAIRAEIAAQDAHGRTVAKCFLPDGGDLSAEMVKLGLAIDWPKFSNGKYGSMEVPGVRKKLWLADARQKGRMHVWEQFEARRNTNATKN